MNPRTITAARLLTVLGFLALLSSSFILRSEVIELSALHLKADAARAANNVERAQESRADRIAIHALKQQDYTVQLQHYRDMLGLYRDDYGSYVQRLDDEYRPPPLPVRPEPPVAPALQDELNEINAEFRVRRADYFERLAVLNRVGCLAALATVGGLLFLVLYDERNRRVFYVALLGMSFVFLIGPAFHSMLGGVIGVLRAPGL